MRFTLAWVGLMAMAATSVLPSGAYSAPTVPPMANFPEQYFEPHQFTCSGTAHEVTPAFAGYQYCQLPSECTTSISMGNSQTPLAFANYAGPNAAPQNFGDMQFRWGRVQAPMAIVLGSSTSNGTQGRPTGKIQYWIETDKFSLLEVVGSYGQDFIDPGLTSNSTTPRATANEVVLKAEFAGFTTTAVHRAKVDSTTATDVISPFWTVIIELDRGRVTGLTWDNSCSGCSKDECIHDDEGAEQGCGLTRTACNDNTNNVSCDLKIYVGWKGTDVSGNYMLSAQSAISNFRRFAAKIAWDIAARTAKQISQGLPDPDDFPSMPDIPI